MLDVTLERAKAGIYKYRGRAYVGEELACEAELLCTMRRIES
jgi:3-hydroxyacyl-[acyl-carrier-protein] dehydratase